MHITNIQLGEKYQPMLSMLQQLADSRKLLIGPATYDIASIVSKYEGEWFKYVDRYLLAKLDKKVKAFKSLDRFEAFAGMCLVLAATNNHIRKYLYPEMGFEEAVAKGTGFLQLMAMKEVTASLTSDEIAGMVAATYMDVVYRHGAKQVFETSGTGGDRGWNVAGTHKTINASTLTAITLASMGHLTLKHGSYGNTAKVGSTDVPVSFGAGMVQTSPGQIAKIIRLTDFWYSDAHAVKTVHFLSHLLMCETVNHIIGPMTPPVGQKTALFKVMGVNHNVAPQTIAKAFTILHEMGVINLGGLAVIAGLDSRFEGISQLHEAAIRRHTILDEVSPFSTAVAFAQGDQYLGVHLLKDCHFDHKPLAQSSLMVLNDQASLMRANQLTLSGKHQEFGRYLARSVAIALLTQEGITSRMLVNELPGLYDTALNTIQSGKPLETFIRYVEKTGGTFKSWV